MADSKELMKDAFSQFIDTLMDQEIATVKSDILDRSEELKGDLKELTQSVAEELEGIRKDTSDSVDQIEESMHEMNDAFSKSFNDLNDTVNERIENLDQVLRAVITEFSSQIFDRMNQQFAELNQSIGNLSERVHHNEEILHNTRDNHGKISMLLNNFASSISSVSPEVASVQPATPAPAQPVQPESVITKAPVQKEEEEPKAIEEVTVAVNENNETELPKEKSKSEIPAEICEATGQYLYKPELEEHDEKFDGFKPEDALESDNEDEVVLDIGELGSK